MDVEQRVRDWVAWFNGGPLDEATRFYAPDAAVQRMGVHPRLSGVSAIGELFAEERTALPGLQLVLGDIVVEGDAAAFEAAVEGFDPAAQRFDSGYLRTGPMISFFNFQDGLIVSDHTYLAASPQRMAPVGLEELTYPESTSPLPPLLARWERLYESDPVAMMNECYTPDGTVQAMQVGSRPTHKERQIQGERRSFAAFPGHRIRMKRWLVTPQVIAVEFTWEGEHHRDPSRTLRTISACHLRLRDGLIAVDHSYIPTGPA